MGAARRFTSKLQQQIPLPTGRQQLTHVSKNFIGEIKVIRGQSQKRMARWPKTNNGDGELYRKSTAFNVVLREACVF